MVIFQPEDYLYLDESKARGYYVVATASTHHLVRETEKILRTLTKPGQRRIHFIKERDSRRRELLSRMCELDVRAFVWNVAGLPDKLARPMCLRAVVEEALRARVTQLFIEQDASLKQADRRLIAGLVRSRSLAELNYQHVSPHEQPLLWISDAIAWCYSKGGDWRRRAEPLVGDNVFRLRRT